MLDDAESLRQRDAAGERARERAERRPVVAREDQQVVAAARSASAAKRSREPSSQAISRGPPRSSPGASRAGRLDPDRALGARRRVVDAADEVPRQRRPSGALADARRSTTTRSRARGSRRCRRSPPAPRSPAGARRRARACRGRAMPACLRVHTSPRPCGQWASMPAVLLKLERRARRRGRAPRRPPARHVLDSASRAAREQARALAQRGPRASAAPRSSGAPGRPARAPRTPSAPR